MRFIHTFRCFLIGRSSFSHSCMFVSKQTMAATGTRVVFFGSHKRPSYVVEKFVLPREDNLQNGEILIKVLMTTICPVDLDHIDGRRDVITPCVLGHESVGEVIASKRYVDGEVSVSPGDRVTFNVVNKSGNCCICEEVDEYCDITTSKNSLNGTFSTNMILKPNIHVVQIPANVGNSTVCPANCLLSTMIHAVTFLQSISNNKHSVAVIQGANMMGLYGCALLKEAGFDHVYCQDTSHKKLSLIPQFGGIPIVIGKTNGLGGDKEHSSPPTADVVINVCNELDVASSGLNLLCHGGIYIVVGFAHDSRSHDLNVDIILKKEITVKGIRGYEPVHLDKAVEFLSKTADRYPYEQLCSPPHSLEDFHIAVKYAKANLYHRIAIAP